MQESKNTKRALAASIGCMALCVALLVGTTFAWFTDTASTSVNKIESGTLGVELLNAANENIEGQTLSFKKHEDGKDQPILWEPGCRYELPAVYVKNNGSLALKYKIQITGIKGDEKLNDAIKWTITDGGDTADLGADHTLGAGKTSGPLVIKGEMRDDAGNEYQGLSIEGITITVVATQQTAEFDSYSDQYDKDAVYPVVATIVKATASGTMGDSATDPTEINYGNGLVTASIPAGVVKAGSSVALTVDRKSMTADSVTFDIDFKVNNESIATALSQPITATVNIGTGLKDVKVTHSGTPMTESDSRADQTYSYNAKTGILTIVTSSFSPFTISYNTDFEASINGIGYASFVDAFNSVESGSTVALQKDVQVKLNDTGSKYETSDHSLWSYTPNVTLDLNGKTLTTTSNNGGSYNVLNIYADGWTIKNGTIVVKKADGKDDSYALGFESETDAMKMTLENLTLSGGVSGYGNVTITMNDIKSVMATNYYCCYAEGENGHGAKFEINGGKYISNGDMPIFYAWINSPNITVNGGEFSGKIFGTDSDQTKVGTLFIAGGTFNNDPTAYVDTTNYNVTNSGNTWTVAAK